MTLYNVKYRLGTYIHGISGRMMVSGIIEKIILSTYETEYYVRDEHNNKLYKITESKIIYQPIYA